MFIILPRVKLLSVKCTYQGLLERVNPWVAEQVTALVMDSEHS